MILWFGKRIRDAVGKMESIEKKEGEEIPRPAIRTPRPRLGISCCSTAPANWFLSSLRKEESRLSRAPRERRTWRKNPPDVTLARHPVFQSGIDKKSLPESQRGNNYARNIMARSREPRAARIASGPRFPARVRVTRKFFPRMIYRDEGGPHVFHFPSSVPPIFASALVSFVNILITKIPNRDSRFLFL